MSDLVLVEPQSAGICFVTLNRSERRNALSIDLMKQLLATLDSLEADAGNRVAILRGDGPVFCAGLDLKEAADPQVVEESADCVKRSLDKVRSTSLIVIAAVRGGAFAGGAGLMAACDLVVAAEDARIAFPEARRGLLPALITGVLAPKIREGDLRELFLVGDAISAARAQQVGLVQRVVAAEDVDAEALRAARSIIEGGPETIRATKRFMNEIAAGASPAELVAAHLDARKSEEAQEGLAAFREKRKPRWIPEDNT